MPVWVWILTAATTVFGLSGLISVAVAAILGRISREVSELLEMELWASAPLKPAKTAAARA
jgi:hypothetical protein